MIFCENIIFILLKNYLAAKIIRKYIIIVFTAFLYKINGRLLHKENLISHIKQISPAFLELLNRYIIKYLI